MPQEIDDWEDASNSSDDGISDWADVGGGGNEKQYEDQPSMLDKYDRMWFNKSVTDLPTRIADVAAEPMMKYGESGSGLLNTASLYGGAFLHNVGEGVSGMFSPLNVATMGTGELVGPTLKLGRALSEVAPSVSSAVNTGAKVLHYGSKALTAPMIASGGARFARGVGEGNFTDMGTGAIEALMAYYGMKSKFPELGAIPKPGADAAHFPRGTDPNLRQPVLPGTEPRVPQYSLSPSELARAEPTQESFPFDEPVQQGLDFLKLPPARDFTDTRMRGGQYGATHAPEPWPFIAPDAQGQAGLPFDPGIDYGTGVFRGSPFEKGYTPGLFDVPSDAGSGPTPPPNVPPNVGGGEVPPTAPNVPPTGATEAPTIAATEIPGVNIEGNVATIIKVTRPALNLLKQAGFEPWVGHTNPDGAPQWIRTGSADPAASVPSTGGIEDSAFVRAMKASKEAGSTAPIPFNDREGLVIPADQVGTKVITSLEKQGYTLTGTNENGDGIFKRLLREEEGSVSHSTAIANARQGLRDFFGLDAPKKGDWSGETGATTIFNPEEWRNMFNKSGSEVPDPSIQSNQEDLYGPTEQMPHPVVKRQIEAASNAPKTTVPTEPPVKPGAEGNKPSVIREAYNFSRGATTTADLSAAMRQGLPLITRKEWWTSWIPQMKSLGSEGAFKKTLADIESRPLFQNNWDPVAGKVIKSYAEQAGMKLSDLSNKLGKREEAVASNWVESGQMFGKDNAVQGAYKGTAGRVARASNRAYTAFLNQLRADTFESLLKEAHADFQAGTKGAKNPYTDLTFAREIADFVNTATGRGPLKLATPTIEGGRLGLKERSLEQHAGLLTDLIFSPRLMASRVRMLNPATYAMATPFVRKQYLKALISVGGFWGTAATLGKMGGGEVNTDSNSADFGKIKMGNLRIDPAAGFQQYVVLASRLVSGHVTSSATGKDFETGQGYRAPTRLGTVQGFATNKLHPVVKFANDLLAASTNQPFNIADRTAQMFVPLIVGDTLDLAREDPKLIPWLAPIAAGMGSQVYDKNSASQGRLWPSSMDYSFTGGEVVPWQD